MGVQLSPGLFNDNVSNWYKALKRYVVIYGGSGSGKSYGIAQLLIMKVMRKEELNVICFRKHSTDARNSIFALFKQIINELELTEYFKINHTAKKITYTPNGNIIYITGLDNSEKIKSVTSDSGIFSIAWVEEATEITYTNLKQVSLRLRGMSKHRKTIYLSFNPISEEHWLKKDFIDTRNDEIDIFHSTYLDNKFIDKAYKAELEQYKTVDENYYAIYAKGQWGVPLQGLVYPAIWKIQNVGDNAIVETIYGLDFGFSTSKTALIQVNIVDFHIIYIRLLWYKTGTHIDAQFAGWLKSFVGNSPIYCDSAGSDKIEFLYEMGLNAKKSDKNVVSGVQLVQSIENIHIAKDSLEIVKEKNGYKWAVDKNGSSLGSPQKNLDDHALDALRYALFTHFNSNIRYIKHYRQESILKEREVNIDLSSPNLKVIDTEGKMLILTTALELRKEHGKILYSKLSEMTGYSYQQCDKVLTDAGVVKKATVNLDYI